MTVQKRIAWLVSDDISREVKALRDAMGEDCYREMRKGLREKFRHYVGSHKRCTTKALGISPLGGDGEGSKVLKIRCGLPGRGASRSLRVTVLAHCGNQRVVITEVKMRRDK